MQRLWKKRVITPPQEVSPLMKNQAYFDIHFCSVDYEIERSSVELCDILGEGQFGDVHRGIYSDNVSLHCICRQMFIMLFYFLLFYRMEIRLQ
jgi:hypothetical protein